jgi:hypothetical protein
MGTLWHPVAIPDSLLWKATIWGVNHRTNGPLLLYLWFLWKVFLKTWGTVPQNLIVVNFFWVVNSLELPIWNYGKLPGIVLIDYHRGL